MANVTDYKNPHYSAEGENQIDLEILTEEFGWIPTTININDGDNTPHIKQIKEWLNNNADSISEYVAPIVPVLTDNEIADINRREEYGSAEDQLDMIFHDLEDGTSIWRDKIRAIKIKHPKV